MIEDETRRVIGPSFDPDGPGYELDHSRCATTCPLCPPDGSPCICRCHRYDDADRGAYDMAPGQ